MSCRNMGETRIATYVGLWQTTITYLSSLNKSSTIRINNQVNYLSMSSDKEDGNIIIYIDFGKGFDSITNFIWPYLHQFFDDSHSLNSYEKPLKRPFNQYQSHLKVISIGQDIRYATNFIWPYLHQFFIDSHSLNGYGKPLKRPFDRYQSRLEAISNGRDIR